MEQNIRLEMLCCGTLNMLDGFADSLTDVILTKSFFAIETSSTRVTVKTDTLELL